MALRVNELRGQVAPRLGHHVSVAQHMAELVQTLFFFEPGTYVLRRSRAIGKLAPKRDGPYKVETVTGQMKQRVTIRSPDGRLYHCHASKLTPYLGEVNEADWVAPRDSPEAGAPPAPPRKRGRPRKRPADGSDP